MKTIQKTYLVIIILALCAFLTQDAVAQSPTPQPVNEIIGDQIIIGNTYRLEAGDTLEGNLLIVGGTAAIAKDATINGDIILTGGTISLGGTSNGDIVAIGGAVTIEDYATVNGNLVMIGASLKKSPLARITGDITEETPRLLDFDFQKIPFVNNANPLDKILNAGFQSLALAALAVILGLLLPEQIKRVAGTITREPLIAGGVGLLTSVLAPILVVILAITIILIPVSALVVIILVLACLMGYIAVGYEIGLRLAVLFKTTWHPSISAGLGTLLLTLVTGFINLLPCVGWLITFVVGILGLGAVVISRFGSSKFASRVVQAVITPPSSENPLSQEPSVDS